MLSDLSVCAGKHLYFLQEKLESMATAQQEMERLRLELVDLVRFASGASEKTFYCLKRKRTEMRSGKRLRKRRRPARDLNWPGSPSCVPRTTASH